MRKINEAFICITFLFLSLFLFNLKVFFIDKQIWVNLIVLTYLLICISTACTCCALFKYTVAQYSAVRSIKNKLGSITSSAYDSSVGSPRCPNNYLVYDVHRGSRFS